MDTPIYKLDKKDFQNINAFEQPAVIEDGELDKRQQETLVNSQEFSALESDEDMASSKKKLSLKDNT